LGLPHAIAIEWRHKERQLKRKRLTRAESKAVTRSKLLASASEVVALEGYDNASVERIAEEAGFSKGAFYSNFQSKEEIFLELLEIHSQQDIVDITALLKDVVEPKEIIETISRWVDSRNSFPSWGILALELFRNSTRDKTFGDRHAKLFVKQWTGLGEILLVLFPDRKRAPAPQILGGLVFELTYGSAARFVSGPTPGAPPPSSAVQTAMLVTSSVISVVVENV
jgi:AcrR family transcriptional regulator